LKMAEKHGEKSNRSLMFEVVARTMPDMTVTINGKQYVLLEEIGKGGSSNVFKSLSEEFHICAIKRVPIDPKADHVCSESCAAAVFSHSLMHSHRLLSKVMSTRSSCSASCVAVTRLCA